MPYVIYFPSNFDAVYVAGIAGTCEKIKDAKQFETIKDATRYVKENRHQMSTWGHQIRLLCWLTWDTNTGKVTLHGKCPGPDAVIRSIAVD